jgi:hypothetical protein
LGQHLSKVLTMNLVCGVSLVISDVTPSQELWAHDELSTRHCDAPWCMIEGSFPHKLSRAAGRPASHEMTQSRTMVMWTITWVLHAPCLVVWRISTGRVALLCFATRSHLHDAPNPPKDQELLSLSWNLICQLFPVKFHA